MELKYKKRKEKEVSASTSQDQYKEKVRKVVSPMPKNMPFTDRKDTFTKGNTSENKGGSTVKLDEEDTSAGYQPMLTSSGMLGRGFRAGFDGEVQAERMIDTLVQTLTENDRAQNASATAPAIDTVFPLSRPKVSIHEFCHMTSACENNSESEYALTDSGMQQSIRQLNIVPSDLFDSVSDLKRSVGALSSKKYLATRNKHFPECTSGSKRYRNRAGDKLEAVLESSGIASDIRKHARSVFVFADLCGGPGAFSEMLFTWIPQTVKVNKTIGTGITLDTKQNIKGSLAWYPSLLERQNAHSSAEKNELLPDGTFVPCFGSDSTGNILHNKNMDYFVKQCQDLDREYTENTNNESGKAVDLVVADGGFCVDGQESLQEVLSFHLLLCEAILALRILRVDGSFVLKAFDTLTPSTVGLLYVLSLCFESVLLCKPDRSRVVNSERYIVCHKVKEMGESALSAILNHLMKVHRGLNSTKEKNRIPREVIPIDFLLDDFNFLDSVRTSTAYWMKRQKNALEVILKEAK